MPTQPNLKFELDATRLRGSVQKVKKGLEDMHAIYEDIGEYEESVIESRFDRMVGPDGRPWKKLAPSTKASKRNKGRTLIETGRMAESLGRNVTQDYLDIGFSDQKAIWHQQGTKPYTIRPRVARRLAFIGANGKRVNALSVKHPGLTARPMLGVNSQSKAEFNRIIARHVAENWEK